MKMKKFVAGIMAFCVVVGAMPANTVNFFDNSIVASAEDEFIIDKSGVLTYQKYSDHVVIVGCQLTAIKVDIPAKIEGLPVTEIGYCAFEGCSTLKSVTIPDSVTEIGNSAFYGCSSLAEITIPKSVISIGGWAFGWNFGCTPWLRKKQEENPLVIVNNILIDGTTCEGNVIIPDDVTKIGGNAFEYCSSLTEITIPESVTKIYGGAFSYCESLTEITIPDSVTEIGDGTFWYCSNLTKITIPESVTSIDMNTFNGCSSLTEIAIPNSVTSIGYAAFYDCSNLTKITIPDSVTEIGSGAFGHCESLTEITILNPYCQITNYNAIISNGYDDDFNGYYNGVICGYAGSTAQAYAEKYDIEFVSLGKAPTSSEEKTDVLLGDANCDGQVNMADAAAIIQHIGNKDTYALSEQGAVNADCDSQEGITGNDALAVQLLLAKQIDKLPYTE